jgi:hypothetical protein
MKFINSFEFLSRLVILQADSRELQNMWENAMKVSALDECYETLAGTGQ